MGAMDTITAQHGDCLVVVHRRATADGRPVLLVEASGPGSSAEFAACLAQLARAGVFTRRTMAILDTRKSERQTEARGLFAQAEVLARAHVQTLYLCYLADTEGTAALTPMISDIFQQAGISTAIHICRSQDDALVWLNQQC